MRKLREYRYRLVEVDALDSKVEGEVVTDFAEVGEFFKRRNGKDVVREEILEMGEVLEERSASEVFVSGFSPDDF